MKKEKKPIAISLFSGAGGCSLGFKHAGYDVLYAIDLDEVAVATYKANFPETVCEVADITKIDFKKLMHKIHLKVGELDILIGGPPCQGFSTAGMRFWDDPRNHLLKSYVEALKIIRPKWFIMENVEGLLTMKRGRYVYEAAKAFITLGYTIRIDKIYAQEYGIPQRRKRVFVVGNNAGHTFSIPTPLNYVYGAIYRNSDITLRHVISNLPFPKQGEDGVIYYDKESQNGWEEQLRNPKGYVTDHYFPLLNDIQRERIQSLKPGQTMKHLPEHLQHESFKRRAYRRVKDGTPTEKRGGAPSGMKRLIYDEPSLTITGASTREFIHPEQDRPLTIRECARIQTFPDWFRFLGSASQKIQQIGNAIPPLLAQIFAEHIIAHDGLSPYYKNEHGKLLGFTLTKATAMSPALEETQQLLAKLIISQNTLQLSLFEGENENTRHNTSIAQCL